MNVATRVYYNATIWSKRFICDAKQKYKYLSLQACLSCANVACGRYNEEHALQHFKETQVCLIWCVFNAIWLVYLYARLHLDSTGKYFGLVAFVLQKCESYVTALPCNWSERKIRLLVSLERNWKFYYAILVRKTLNI